MEYDKKLIDKAKGSRCRICQDEITEYEAENQEFQATQTIRGGVLLYTYPVLDEGEEMIPINDTIYTAHIGNNSGLIKNVASLYFKPGDRIADVTYGRGAFWRKIDQGKYDIVGSDILTGIDFRSLPYKDNEFDHSVIDPPYARKDLQGMVNCYQTTKSATHSEIIKLYEDGLKELIRITKKNGYILCKCQDEIYGCLQKWSHIEIKEIAEQLGLYAKDLFILVNQKKPRPVVRQLHARKLHSYLWVFQVR